MEQNVDTKMLTVENLSMHFAVKRGVRKKLVGEIKAVDNVSFTMKKGETLGLVGESGCGKSTIGRCLIRAYTPTGGRILYRFSDGREVDFAALGRRELRQFRKYSQMVFQDPYGSLDPRMTVVDIIGEPLYIQGVNRESIVQRVRGLMEVVGLNPKFMNRYPHAFSGGQRQRIAVARVLATDPEFVVADEPVSALDGSVQAQVINLIEDLQKDYSLTLLFVSHDLSVVEHIADRVAVMYLGKIVEMAATDRIFRSPSHPYTEALLGSIPRISGAGKKHRHRLEGEVGNSLNLPKGCSFHPRCRYATDMCREVVPDLSPRSDGGLVACHLSESLNLTGYYA